MALRSCREVREKKTDIMVLKKDDIDKIRGLGLGADDYMTKPFPASCAREQHIWHGTNVCRSGRSENDIVEIRGIKIDKTARRVWVNKRRSSLRQKEFDLLTFLARIRTASTKRAVPETGYGVDREILRRLRCISRRSVKD